jgi:hypothetical protein
MKIKALILLFFMLTGGALAQAPEDPTARIAWLQEAEHSLLTYRRSLLDRETDLSEPLWIVNDEGLVFVVDGGPIYDNASVLAELAASFGIDQTLGADADPILRTLAEAVAAGRVSDMRARVRSAYEEASIPVRAAALAELDRRLGAVRQAVTATLQERDGTDVVSPAVAPEDEGWRARLARAGVSLPVSEGNLVYSENYPSYDGGRCEVSPVYIHVRGEGRSAACSTGNWRYLGRGLTLPEGTGRCVWCPSGYWWRSGVGCCYPE